MKTRKDLTGQKFGMYTVLGYSHTKDAQPYWVCRCDCGNERVVAGNNLKRGKSISCGCSRRVNIKHNTRLYHIHGGMIQRCYNKNSPEYEFYGGRGIEICEEWRTRGKYENFRKWAISNGYTDELTIDRKDVNGNYEPSNCRWITNTEQQRNKRNTVYVEYKGRKMTLFELSDLVGVPKCKLYDRLFNKHIPIDIAVNKTIERKPRSNTTKRLLEFLSNPIEKELVYENSGWKDAKKVSETLRSYSKKNNLSVSIFVRDNDVHVMSLGGNRR